MNIMCQFDTFFDYHRYRFIAHVYFKSNQKWYFSSACGTWHFCHGNVRKTWMVHVWINFIVRWYTDTISNQYIIFSFFHFLFSSRFYWYPNFITLIQWMNAANKLNAMYLNTFALFCMFYFLRKQEKCKCKS